MYNLNIGHNCPFFNVKCFPVIKISLLIFFGEVIAFHCDSFAKHKNKIFVSEVQKY